MVTQQSNEQREILMGTQPNGHRAYPTAHPGPAPQRMFTAQRLLLACSIVGALLFNGTYLIAGAFRPGYDSLRFTISALESGPQGWIQIANFIVFGLFTFGFAIGLRMALVSGIGSTLAPLFEILVGVGLIGDGVFLHDPLHTLCDILTFSAAVAVCIVLAIRFIHDSRWRGWPIYSIATAILTIACLVAFGIAMSHNGYAGLFEKLAAIIRSVWVILLTLRVLTGTSLAPLIRGTSGRRNTARA